MTTYYVYFTEQCKKDAAMGRTDAGRYLIIYFIHKATKEALMSAHGK